MKDLKLIVERLNRPPFSMSLTLVTFHNKSPFERLQLVNDVFAYLDPKMKKDLRDEGQDVYGTRMLEFLLGTINYKPATMDIAAFTEQFLRGSPDVLYPVLFWMMDQLDVLKKRSYLARFLTTIEVPEEMFADTTVVGLYQEYKALQAEFKEIHKTIDRERLGSLKPSELEAEIEQLTQEREQLQAKLAGLKERVSTQPQYANVNFAEVLETTHSLRKAQEEEAKLYQSIQEEKYKKARAEQLYQQTKHKLKDLEDSDISHANPQKILARLRDDVRKLRAASEAKLGDEIRKREKILHELEDVVSSEPMSEDQVTSLSIEVSELQRVCEDLTNKRDRLHSAADGKIGFYRERVAAVEKKKEKLQDQLEELEEEKRDAENDLKQLAADLKSLEVGGEKPKTDAEMKAYMKELTKKTAKYKEMKTELQVGRDEIGVLSRTQDILKNKLDNLQEFNEDLEKERGVQGALGVQGELEAVSSQKADIDNTKGQTLDQISRIVADITSTLKQRKNKLAPQIKELRSIRNKFEEVEAVYLKKKKQHDNIALGLESERMGLEKEVEDNVLGIQEEESAYHFLNCLSTITQVRLDQMSQELSYQVGDERLNSEHKSYKEMYERSITAQEDAAKRLRQEKVKVKESHGDHVNQRSMFLDLRKVMECKMKMQAEQAKKEDLAADSLVFGGADVLEINQGM